MVRIQFSSIEAPSRFNTISRRPKNNHQTPKITPSSKHPKQTPIHHPSKHPKRKKTQAKNKPPITIIQPPQQLPKSPRVRPRSPRSHAAWPPPSGHRAASYRAAPGASPAPSPSPECSVETDSRVEIASFMGFMCFL